MGDGAREVIKAQVRARSLSWWGKLQLAAKAVPLRLCPWLGRPGWLMFTLREPGNSMFAGWGCARK